MVYHPLSRLVPLFIQQRYDTNPAVRSTCSQKIYLPCLSGVEGLLSEAQKPLNDHVTNLQLNTGHPCRGAPPGGLGSMGRLWKAPRRGAFFIARVSEGCSPDDPGDVDGSLFPSTPPGVGRHGWSPEGATPYRGRTYKEYHRSPGVFGTSCLDTRAMKKAPLSGCFGPFSSRESRGVTPAPPTGQGFRIQLFTLPLRCACPPISRRERGGRA